VVHLATVPGGAAELDPALAKRVNIDATMALIDAAALAGNRPRFIFASSIAVFGDPLPPQVDDSTPIAPMMVYGAHKAMMEGWIENQTRRGAIAGMSLRLPGIVARPLGPSGMKSAFLSNLFHALSVHQAIELPVSPEATLWLMSVGRIARNLIHALGIDATGTFTLPAIRTSMHDLVHAIVRATGSDPALATYAPDAALEAGFGRQPPLTTNASEALGFAHDGSLDDLVAAALQTLA
jgi:nucleoside-diphosphate-sugar epimerase